MSLAVLVLLLTMMRVTLGELSAAGRQLVLPLQSGKAEPRDQPHVHLCPYRCGAGIRIRTWGPVVMGLNPTYTSSISKRHPIGCLLGSGAWPQGLPSYEF